ncbi:MAG: cation diffusion facilitator family transporter [Candidatus Dormibacteria bacterium]
MTAPAPSTTLLRVRLAIGAVSIIAILEIVGGLASGSLALLSDAGHLVTDSATLGLTWLAVSRSRRPAGAEHTFGHHRGGIVVAALNGAVLVVIAAAIAASAISRLQHPTVVAPVPVLLVGLLALLGNGLVAILLRGAGGGLGVQSAALHVIADALTDAAVVVGAITLLVFGWMRADAVVSLLIAVLIVIAAVRLLGEALHILNEGTPRDLDAEGVGRRIAALPGIEGVHDLHIWSLDREHRALSAHVIVADRPLAEVTAMIRSVELLLCEEFGIDHATVQPECPACSTEAPLYCNIAGHHELVHLGAREPL